MSLGFPKPAPGSGRAERFARKQARRREAETSLRQIRLAALNDERKRRSACYVRDGGRCRRCGQRVWLRSDSPVELAHCHHIVFRSAGGSDELHNRVTLCATCHGLVHQHRLDVAVEADGAITFTARPR